MGQQQLHPSVWRRFMLRAAMYGCYLFLVQPLPAQPIPCDGAYYLFLVSSVSSNTTAMYRVTADERTGLLNFELVNPSIPHRIAGVGYSVVDQKIHALDYNTKRLLRIDAKGSVEVFAVPLYLDTTHVFFAGEVNPSGNNLLVVGRDLKTDKDVHLFSIRLRAQAPVAGRVSLLSDFGTALEDLAFDPLRGTLYGYDAQQNKLTWVDNFSGRISDYFSRTMSGIGNLGSLFFDRMGNLHAYGTAGSEESTLYLLDKLRGSAAAVDAGPSGRFTDGCACPYTIRTFKTVTPEQALPCDEITVTYHLINHAGTAYSYISINDTFPEGFVIKKIVKAPLTAVVVSGEGSNILSLKEMDLILDTNRIIVTLEATSALPPGTYASQATIKELPAAFGGRIYSDNPLTSARLDATAIEVIGTQNKGTLTRQQPLCTGGGVLLQLKTPPANASYQWSNGATEAATTVNTSGWHAVTITTDCGDFVDSIFVAAIPEVLQVELGAPQNIALGETITITPQVNTTRPLTFQWQASDSLAITCANCAALPTRPVRTTNYTLTIRDQFGCTAQATTQVTVQPVYEVFAATAFSPNNDGVNDVFYLQGKSDAKIIYLRIFDRWGNQIFQVRNGVLNDPTYGWNGKMAAKAMSTQSLVYVAELEFPDGTRKRLSGEVALLR